MSDTLLKFQEEVEQKQTPEEKIRLSIDCMKSSLAKEKNPDFKAFWEVKKFCLPLFREASPHARSPFWKEYIEISEEAKKLKDLLEEEANFTSQQIDLAITALEKEEGSFEGLLQKTTTDLLESFSEFEEKQKELILLNALAHGLQNLRREVLSSGIRIRHKNNFLKRLSDLGGRCFPKRKQLIDEVSAAFKKKVEKFLATEFRNEKIPFYELRQRIKEFQETAKKLTLTPSAISEMRRQLSECWDVIRKKDLERRAQIQERKDEVQKEIDIAEARWQVFSQKELGATKAKQEYELFIKELKEIKLPRNVFLDYESKAQGKMGGISEKAKAEMLLEEKKKVGNLHEEIVFLCEQEVPSEEMEKKIDEINHKIENVSLLESRKLRHMLQRAIDCLYEKREVELLKLVRKAQDLESIVEKKKGRKKEIKEKIVEYRRLIGRSSFDFEQAILLNEWLEEEKGRLEKVESSLLELEEKLNDLST